MGPGIEATWKPKWNRGSGSQLLLGIGVPFLTWFRNRLSDPGPVLRNSGIPPLQGLSFSTTNFDPSDSPYFSCTGNLAFVWNSTNIFQTPVSGCECGSRAGKISPARPSGNFFVSWVQNIKIKTKISDQQDRTAEQDNEMKEDLFE